MKKILCILTMLAFVSQIDAQTKGSYISVSGGLGSSGFRYQLLGTEQDGIRKNKFGWSANLGYSYFFTPHWGISTGIGISHYRSVGIYPDEFSKDNYFNLGNQIDNDDISGNVRNYELRTRLSNWHEEQKSYFIEIPLLAMYQYKFGKARRHGFYIGAGAKLQIPIISSTYKVMDASYANDLRLNVSGFYSDKNMEVGDPDNPAVLQHGFGSINNPYEKLDWKGDLSIKMSIAATIKAGFLFGLGKRVDLMVGAYVDWGLNNIKKIKNDPLMTAPEQYLPNANNNIGKGIQYNGMINSDRTSKVNLVSYSAEVGIRIKLGKLHEQPSEIEKNNIPIVNCCDSLKVELNTDSIERQLDRILLLLAVEQKSEKKQVVQGVVKDSKTNVPLSALVELTDARTNKILGTFRTDSMDGKYKFDLPSEGSYAIDVKKEGYLYYSENFIVPQSDNSQTINQIIFLNKLEVDQVIILKNIFFDTDKTTLKSESMKEIEHVYHLMKDNPTMEIELSGHTDNVGNAAYNKNLSLRRANVVKEVLVNKGIQANRITTAGYGFDKPIATNNTPEGRAENRRTEFKIKKM